MTIIRHLGIQPYTLVWNDMKRFTIERVPQTSDELWLLEHPAVYTQGQAGKAAHILNSQNIPIVQSDRGGQVTYHGPGQLIAYTLIDIGRLNLSIRTYVCQLELVIINLLQHFDIHGHTRIGAPGIYVNEKKIASIGLRVKNGCTYHGVALNVSMNLNPFSGINPCGYAELIMTQMSDYVPDITVACVQDYLSKYFITVFE